MSPRDDTGLEPTQNLVWLQTSGGTLHAKTKDDQDNVVAVTIAEHRDGWGISIRWDKHDVETFDPPGRWEMPDDAQGVAERMLADLPTLELDIRYRNANPPTGFVEGELPW